MDQRRRERTELGGTCWSLGAGRSLMLGWRRACTDIRHTTTMAMTTAWHGVRNFDWPDTRHPT